MSLAVLAGAIGGILLFVAVGVVLKRAGLLQPRDARVLNSVIVYVALPALIFRTVATAALDLQHLEAVGVAWAVSLAGLSVAWEVAHVLGLARRTAGAFVLVAALGNTGYIGYPLVRALLGEAALAPAVFYDVFGTVAVLLTLGLAVAARHGEHQGRLNIVRELLTFPAVIAMLAALVYRFVPWPDPVHGAVMDWTGMAATMAMPLIMLSLGVSLDPGALRGSLLPLTAVAGIKLLLLPSLAFGVAVILKDTSGVRMLALQAGMPSAMLSLVLAERFKLDEGFTAAAIMATMLGCLLTIPVVQFLIP